MRARFAPSTARTASSFCRADQRTSIRFATFAQTISSTSATATWISGSSRTREPAKYSRSGVALIV